jgi:hypothetical protein
MKEQEIVAYEKWCNPDWFDNISKQWDVYEKLAALNFTITDIATYYSIDKLEFVRYYKMVDSPLKYHYDRGILLQKAQEGISMLVSAKTGDNVVQMMRLDKERQEKDFENTLNEIIFHND